MAANADLMAWPKGVPRKAAEPVPSACFRLKRVGAERLLQQAWRHADGTEWRNVETVPAEAPDWEAASAPPAPPGR